MRLKSSIYLFVASILMLFSACTPEQYDLDEKDVTPDDLVEGLAYTITHDPINPNIVYLESKMGNSYTALWEHPQGRSQEKKVTLQIPFDGTYTVRFGVQTRGGVVYGEPATFIIHDFYAGFVTNELWTLLTGGVGASKTWIPDNGKYGLAPGELSYADPGGTVEWNNWSPNWEPAAGFTMAAGDNPIWESSMTFDLINGANVAIDDRSSGGVGQKKGSFMLNTDAHTITFTDADLLHTAGWSHMTSNWKKDLKILTLTENQLRIGILRQKDTSGEDPWWIIWNYVSKEYADNYEAPAQEIFPTLPDDWRDYVEPKTNLVTTYKLSDDKPFDWCNLDGSQKGIANIAARSGVEEVTLVLNSGTGDYTLTDLSGVEHKGKYSLNNEGIYTFSEALPEIELSADGRAIFKSNPDRTLRIMSYETSDFTGGLTDLWLASKELDDQGNLYQYMGYHFVAQTAGAVKSYKATMHFFDTGWTFTVSEPLFIAGDGDYTFVIPGASSAPYGLYLDIQKILKENPNMDVAIKDIKVDGASISFDDTVIDRGIGDDDTTARRYILNPWGATAGDAPKYVFSSTIAVTVTVKMDNGTPFIVE
ncbi:MAG: hypothetical protein A2W86_04345 [Bacteroidetes bacterium GWD2_45_23]|nr:MAG: hypothetical protein A2W87_13690 [Bacteroidetes bacterium GWC2_46_850]OFX86317.1 MAG: hypothetical protein A2W86_04345 [Bacteroidetes bacterium GWD2_45_23]HBA99707.1 hypothetical protein [Porphyromonadaceae bacterium]HCC17463.1 hypothetical protein [Porphyromonadaceae bacterium]